MGAAAAPWGPSPAYLAAFRPYAWVGRRWRVPTDAGGRPLPARRGGGDLYAYAPYLPGDDLRQVDWRASARRERAVVRRREAEATVRIYIWVDRSGSMAFRAAGDPSACPSKWEVAREVAAALAWAAEEEGAAVAIHPLAAPPRSIAPPRPGRASWRAQVAALGRAAPAGQADIAAILARLAAALRGPAWLVLLSDLHAPSLPLAAALRALAGRGHRCLLLRVATASERGAGCPSGALASMEDAARPATWGGGAEQAARLAAHSEHLDQEAARAGVGLATLIPGAPPQQMARAAWRARQVGVAAGGGGSEP